MPSSSPPRTYSPLKSHPSEDTIQAFPLAFDNPRVSLEAPHDSLLQVSSDTLQRLAASLQAFSSRDGGSVQREALDLTCQSLIQIAARAQDLSSASIRSLLEQIEQCRDLVNGHSYDNIHTLAPEFVRLGVFHEVLSLALEHQLTDELATASTKTPAGSAQDISELKSAVVQLTGCVQHLMGDSGSKQYKLFGNGSTPLMNQESPGNMLDSPYAGGSEWSQAMHPPSRELSLSRMHQNGSQHSSQQHSQVTSDTLLQGMNGDQLKRLAVQGLMHQLSPQPAYAPVPQVNVHNMISTDAHAAAATEQNSTQQSNIVTKVKNTLKQARSNMIPLLIGGAAALLFHNHLPILKHISPGGGGRARRTREDVNRERSRTRRTAAAAEEALEECHGAVVSILTSLPEDLSLPAFLPCESMREWREYSRRARGPFNHVPEPSGKCDLRALRSRVMRSAASGGGDNARPSGHGGENDDSSVENSVWRSLLS